MALKLCIHTGSFSIDNHAHVQADTNGMVAAIVAAIPNVQYIAVATYLDYASDILLWANSIHNAGKKLWLRSAGYNEWQGTNGVGANNAATALSNHRTNLQSFITTNPSIFKSGDILEAVPDEPTAGTYFKTLNLLTTGNAAYNGFITGAITDANTALATAGITGVITNIFFESPSAQQIHNPYDATRDLLTTTTAAALSAIGQDSYPETASSSDPFQNQVLQAQSIAAYTNNWGVSNNCHYTFGPNVNLQLTQAQQANAYELEIYQISKLIKNLDGLTIWQAGGTGNPLSRLFDYSSGVWTPRSACKIINAWFGALQNYTATNLTHVRLLTAPAVTGRNYVSGRALVSGRHSIARSLLS